MIEVGNIVKNIKADEAVKISRVKKLGDFFSLTFIGVSSNKLESKIFKESQLDTLEVLTVTSKFNFKGDPEKFMLIAESERVKSKDIYEAFLKNSVKPMITGAETVIENSQLIKSIKESASLSPRHNPPRINCFQRSI